jgi:hypothetical protein
MLWNAAGCSIPVANCWLRYTESGIPIAAIQGLPNALGTFLCLITVYSTQSPVLVIAVSRSVVFGLLFSITITSHRKMASGHLVGPRRLFKRPEFPLKFRIIQGNN